MPLPPPPPPPSPTPPMQEASRVEADKLCFPPGSFSLTMERGPRRFLEGAETTAARNSWGLGKALPWAFPGDAVSKAEEPRS